MATSRKRSTGKWEFVVKRKGLLDKPFVRTFNSEKEGNAYCRDLEALLDKGIVPAELQKKDDAIGSRLDKAIDAYIDMVEVPASDAALLSTWSKEYRDTALTEIDYQWIEARIVTLKRTKHLAPSTIRHYVGALSRFLDWCIRRNTPGLRTNPCKLLPNRYAVYTKEDCKQSKGGRADIARDRRLEPDEEGSVLKTLRERGDPAELMNFILALETAMRMREMYTIHVDQIHLAKCTIFLDKTKNGDKRQVPLTTVAVKALDDYIKQHCKKGGLLFPWWNGDLHSLANTTQNMSHKWQRIFEASGCDDLHFHDLRHEATSRLYERTKLTDLQIAKITGHKTLRMLARYANLRASDLAVHLW